MSDRKAPLAIFGATVLTIGSLFLFGAQIDNPGVHQSGAVTVNHFAKWGPGIGQIQDGGAIPGSFVTSFNARTGAVLPLLNDYNFNQLAGSLACTQAPALTGDVTSSAGTCATTLASVITAGGPIGSGTVAPIVTFDAKGRLTAVSSATIAPPFSAVTGQATLAQLPDIATQRFLGRTTAGTGNVESLTATQATAMLNAAVGDSGAGGTKGLVPAPGVGDAGKVLSGAMTFISTGTGTFAKIVPQVFTSSGTYTPTTGTQYAIGICPGGGGAGGSAITSVTDGSGAGGGGAGSTSWIVMSAATIGASQTITIGAAGAAGAAGNNPGGAGGDTSIGALCIGKGGSGGGGSARGAAGAGGSAGAGGVAGTGTITGTGAPGTQGIAPATNADLVSQAGGGGSTMFGGGGAGQNGVSTSQAAGNAATGCGGGGGGAVTFNGGTSVAGGAGFKGCVYIFDFTTP